MTTFTATLRNHSISQAPEIVVETCNLSKAKAMATRRFGAGFLGHEIALHERVDMGHYYEFRLVATRVIGERGWRDYA